MLIFLRFTYKDVEGVADAVLTGETHFKVKWLVFQSDLFPRLYTLPSLRPQVERRLCANKGHSKWQSKELRLGKGSLMSQFCSFSFCTFSTLFKKFQIFENNNNKKRQNAERIHNKRPRENSNTSNLTNWIGLAKPGEVAIIDTIDISYYTTNYKLLSGPEEFPQDFRVKDPQCSVALYWPELCTFPHTLDSTPARFQQVLLSPPPYSIINQGWMGRGSLFFVIRHFSSLVKDDTTLL